MTKTGLGLLAAGLLGVALYSIGTWLWPPPLPQPPDFFALESSDLRLWARDDQTEVLSRPWGELLKARGSEMTLWIESPEELGPLVFQVRGWLSHVEVRSSGDSQGFEPPPSNNEARFFLEWQPKNARQDTDQPGFFYPLTLSLSGPSGTPSEKGATVALIGSRTFLDRDLYSVDWLGCGLPETVLAGDQFLTLVQARNTSAETWPNQGHARVQLAAIWHGSGEESGPRIELEAAVAPGGEFTRWMKVQAPKVPGRHILEFDLFFEPLVSFSERKAATCRAEIEVR